MPRLATEMQIELDKKLRSGTIKIEDILTDCELIEYLRHKADAVKIMAASECMKIKVDVSGALRDELIYLRKLPEIVPCVVTTNYDTLIEDGLFEGKFKVYSEVSDYYLSGSQGIGEIYKIHGTCTNPATLVLNEEDYEQFHNKSKIVSAKILSVLCDYPLVIMGYSIEDSDVKEIFDNLISSLNDEKLRELERNIVFIQYDPNEFGIVPSIRKIEYEGHVLSIRAFCTNDFLSIFEEISSMEASVSPQVIRKIRQIVKKIQVAEESKGDKYKLIGIDDIAEEDADKLVVVITDHQGLKVLESVPPLTVDSMINDILGIRPTNFDPEVFIRYFASFGQQLYSEKEYVPIFHYMNLSNSKEILKSPFVSKFVSQKREQFKRKIKSIHMPKAYYIDNVKGDDCARALIDESKDYLKPLIVMYMYHVDELSESQAKECLRHIIDTCIEKNSMYRVNLRCAVSYLGFKTWNKVQGPTDKQ